MFQEDYRSMYNTVLLLQNILLNAKFSFLCKKRSFSYDVYPTLTFQASQVKPAHSIDVNSEKMPIYAMEINSKRYVQAFNS